MTLFTDPHSDPRAYTLFERGHEARDGSMNIPKETSMTNQRLGFPLGIAPRSEQSDDDYMDEVCAAYVRIHPTPVSAAFHPVPAVPASDFELH